MEDDIQPIEDEDIYIYIYIYTYYHTVCNINNNTHICSNIILVYRILMYIYICTIYVIYI